MGLCDKCHKLKSSMRLCHCLQYKSSHCCYFHYDFLCRFLACADLTNANILQVVNETDVISSNGVVKGIKRIQTPLELADHFSLSEITLALHR